MSLSLSYRVLKAREVEAALDDLARLRMAVFRDWPYLYDGSMKYERGYVQSYVGKPGAILIAAFAGDAIVGASTGTPMEDHDDDFQAALAGSGLDQRDMFYCAESVMLAGYRGQGAGHVFFEERETHARRMGRRYSAFAAVVRPANHPLCPTDYVPLDGFWRKRGYAPWEGAIAEFRWKDVDQSAETAKPLQFWIKEL